MKQIPENRKDIEKLLYQQLSLLEEQSKNCEPLELCAITEKMIQISEHINEHYRS